MSAFSNLIFYHPVRAPFIFYTVAVHMCMEEGGLAHDDVISTPL